jgi:porphobilinogen synthase
VERRIIHRPRRLRASETLRRLVRETTLEAADLIYPLFVAHGRDLRREIPSMPGVCHFSVDTLVRECAATWEDGVPAVLLFGLPASATRRSTRGLGVVRDKAVARASAVPRAAGPRHRVRPRPAATRGQPRFPS